MGMFCTIIGAATLAWCFVKFIDILEGNDATDHENTERTR